MSDYEPQKDLDTTPAGIFVRIYDVPYELIRLMIGKTEQETEHNLDIFERFIVEKLNENKKKKRLKAQSHRYKKYINRPNINYGYMLSDTGDIIKNESEQEIIYIIIALREQKLSYGQISKELFKMGIKTRTGKERWGTSVIIDILIRELEK